MNYEEEIDQPQNNEPKMTEEIPDDEKFFNIFYNEEIDQKDPSLEGEYIKFYEEEIPFELRIEGKKPPNDSTFVKLIFKILIDSLDDNYSKVKLEIVCDKDLFFYYSTVINIEVFNKYKMNQKLLNKFIDFPDLLAKYLDFCINDPKNYLLVFNVKKNKSGIMELYENLNIKCAEVLSLNFSPVTNDDVIRKQIIYRYKSMKTILKIAKERAKIINDVLNESDPELIPLVKKSVSKIKIDTNIRDKLLIDQ
jgi:hypothetical protein